MLGVAIQETLRDIAMPRRSHDAREGECLLVVTSMSDVAVCICDLWSINLYTLGLDNGQASVDGLDLGCKLFLRNWAKAVASLG